MQDESLNFTHRCPFVICQKKDGVAMCYHLHSPLLFLLMSRTTLPHLLPSQIGSWCPWSFPLYH
uniref:Uncharacterized protein n=1 Tax=Picea glauca TaxID=3330 RepID=A0A101M0X1_PICGL|nr:hypothetical protein ABT39_MTgene4306 [Picea glauca]QHR88432.1 hypothetical protein Q903MT_gene2445 [Picea sitchensis]